MREPEQKRTPVITLRWKKRRRALIFSLRRMMKLSAVAIGIIALALGLFVGCRADNTNSANSNAVAPAKQANGAATVNAQSSPAQSANAQATPTQAATASATPAPVAGVADSLPITDAVAFRDRLLELARSAAFNSQQDASKNGYAIREAWQKQYPQLKFTFFYSMKADPNTISASDTFLTTGAAVSGNYDRLYAFAVADTKGKCAGGAAVIPGDTPNRKISDAVAPTVFKSIDMSNAKQCSGDAAGENYKP